jgi:hypothetical protein
MYKNYFKIKIPFNLFLKGIFFIEISNIKTQHSVSNPLLL